MTGSAVQYLALSDIIALGPIVLEGGLEVRDWGLIESALARPAATVFGEDAYPTVYDKAAALLLSMVTNPPLVDGNKRMGLAATVAFMLKNGLVLVYQEDEAYDFVISLADGSVREVSDVAGGLEGWAQPLG